MKTYEPEIREITINGNLEIEKFAQIYGGQNNPCNIVWTTKSSKEEIEKTLKNFFSYDNDDIIKLSSCHWEFEGYYDLEINNGIASFNLSWVND